MTSTSHLKTISDDELLRRLSDLLKQSRRVESDLVAHIGEVDERRLYARQASSMFAYCTEVLHLSEAEAYLRIAAARAARSFPVLLAMLGDGRLHLSGIAKLAPHLTETNWESVLARAAHKSKREIEDLVAGLAPKPDVPATVRKLPVRPPTAPPSPALQLRPDAVKNEMPRVPARVDAPASVVPPATPAPQVSVQALAPARYKVQFTASAEFREKLEKLKALMRPSVPDGDLATLLEQAVTEKLQRLEAKRFAETKAPRKKLQEADTSPSDRYIPAPVKRIVRRRDSDQCTFVDEKGRRCTERRRLEFHHRNPCGLGRRPQPGEHLFDVSRPQRLPGRARLRQGVDGEIPEARWPCVRDRTGLSGGLHVPFRWFPRNHENEMPEANPTGGAEVRVNEWIMITDETRSCTTLESLGRDGSSICPHRGMDETGDWRSRRRTSRASRFLALGLTR